MYKFFKINKNNFYKSVLFVLLLVVHTFLSTVYAYTQSIDAKLVINKQKNGRASFDVQSNEVNDVYVIINFVSLEGLELVKKQQGYIEYDTKQNAVAVIKVFPGKNTAILLLQPIANEKSRAYSISYKFVYTDPAKNKRDNFAYYLPFEHGVRHTITQGWFGKYSHGGQNVYAVDFDLSAGEKIYAARGGTVIAVKENSKVGGTTSRFSKAANYVLVLHSDNTVASYVHLQFNGANPTVGDKIKISDLIGYAGATGFASGAHLHFDLRESTLRSDFNSVPFNFRDKNGNPVRPQTNKGYYGRFPKKKDFTEIQAKDIVAERYNNYRAAVPKGVKTKTLHLRQEAYDETIVLFMSNTFTQNVSVSVHLILNNIQSTVSLPIKTIIPVKQEIFLGIVKIINMDNNFSIRTKISYVFD